MASVALGVLPGRSLLGLSSGSATARLGPQVAVTAANAQAGRANNSPMVVADPGEGQFLALANRLDAPDYSCSLHVSGDGGKRWTPVTPVPVLPPGADKCYGPEVAIDGKGRIHFAFLGLVGAGNLPMGMFLTTSTDRGRTFSPPRQVQGTLNFGMRMAVDPGFGQEGRIHLVWLHAGAEPGLGSLGTSTNPILASYSDDGGQSFSEPVQVSDSDRRRVVAPALTLGANGAVIVAYYDLLDDARDYQGLEGPTWEGTWELVVARSADRGQTFGPGVVAEAEVVPHERVMVIFTMAPPALVAGGDRVCVAWTDARNGDADVLARCSSNKGQEWGPASRVNEDPLGNGLWQYMPRLAMAPGGRLDVVYLDRRDDQQNLNNDTSYSYSRDGGRTFAPATRLTTTGKSLTLIGQQYAVPSAGERFDFGFRIALLSRDDEALAAWTDTHNSAPTTMAQDIFATTVKPPASEGLSLPRIGVVVALSIAAAMVAVAWGRRRRESGEAAAGATAPDEDDTAGSIVPVTGDEGVDQRQESVTAGE